MSGGTPLTGGMEERSAVCGKALLKRRRFHNRAGEKTQGAMTLVLDLA